MSSRNNKNRSKSKNKNKTKKHAYNSTKKVTTTSNSTNKKNATKKHLEEKKKNKKSIKLNFLKNRKKDKILKNEKDIKADKALKNGKDIKTGKKVKKKHPILKKAIIIILILMLLAILIVGGVFVGIFFSDKFAMTKEDLLIGDSNTIVYDAEGNVIAELSGKENRKIITIEEMSTYLPKAFVAIEDERFYSHKGVDIKRTAAATFTYVINRGSSNFGGSTITQQLVKNITNERESSGTEGMQRKIKEMSRAYQIEKMLNDKDAILELYLNLIPLASSGGDICGVETASIYYFNKSARDLTIEECAFLAGVTHSPSQYNPYRENPNTDRIKSRTKTVLNKMKELGYIDENQYNEAVAKVDAGLPFQKGELPTSTITSYYISAAVEQVVDELVEVKGMSEEYARNRVLSGGLKIYTNQVPAIQQIVETEYKAETYVKPGKTEDNANGHTQSAMVIIEHTTGKVVGCMGGLGSDVNAIGINRIYSAKQPGSSIKPIGVYLPALEKGIINSATVYDNSKTVFGTSYSPPNATSAKSGLCTIRDAIEVSSNIVACKVMSELDPDYAIDYMRQLGITSLQKASEATYTDENGNVVTPNNDSNLSTALGGVTRGISTLEMAAAYAAIANNGVYIEPTFYSSVKDSNENIILQSTPDTRRVMTEANAYIMKSLLKQPVEGGNGTARVCKMNNMDVAAKTGTTNNQYDLWLCGFTPHYTAATWFGYDFNEYVNTYGGSPATLIWASVMKNVHSTLGLEGKRFEKPSNVVTATVCRSSGKCATSSCTSTYTENFVEGTVPSKCEGHNEFEVCSESKKLANEYCEKTETVEGLAMPEKEVNAKWKTSSGDKYTVITEECDVHSEETSKPEEPEIVDTDITVINVIGKTEADARKSLGNINVKVEYKSDSSKSNGIVLSQSIAPGSVVSKEAVITIVVNKKENNNSQNTTNTTTNNTATNTTTNTTSNATNNATSNTTNNTTSNTTNNTTTNTVTNTTNSENKTNTNNDKTNTTNGNSNNTASNSSGTQN